jgi:hypothetical protein
MVIKHTEDGLEQITAAPPSGVWELLDNAPGAVRFVRPQTHRRTVEREQNGFFLRISRVGDYLYEGADLGILLTPGRLMNDDGELTERAKAWVRGIRQEFRGEPTDAKDPEVEKRDIGGFKIL